MRLSFKDPKTIWKGWIIAIIAVTGFLLLFMTRDIVNSWILAYSTTTLVFITLFYAMQTQHLADLQKTAIEEEKKKRIADHGEKRLREFYLPFMFSLADLEGLIKSEKAHRTDRLTKIKEINRFFLNFGYLADEEVIDKVYSFIKSATGYYRLRTPDEKVFWKKEILEIIDALDKEMRTHRLRIRKAIFDVYGFLPSAMRD